MKLYMRDDQQTLGEQPLPWARAETGIDAPVPTLVVAWSLWEPARVGEVYVPPARGTWVIGRDDGPEGERRLALVRRRPGRDEPTGPLSARGISRRQLEVSVVDGGLQVERVGRCSLGINGVESDGGVVRPGDTIHLKNQLLLYCTAAPPRLPALSSLSPAAMGAFGATDAHGIVGESAAAWRLRDELAFAAASDAHVLVLGPSGSGKELAARAIHAMSRRGDQAIVARNAASFPAELVDAELFGNVRDYPNPRMPDRAGLVGEASGSTLFLDEIGEMPDVLQAHLLRVLDSDGEYQRLGEARSRRSDLRVVAATNRRAEELRPDVLARFAIRIAVPPLDARREDVPLIARQLLGEMAEREPRLRERFFDREGPRRGEARIDPELVEDLLRRSYPLNVRELSNLLWTAMSASSGSYIERAACAAAPAANAVAEDEAGLEASSIREALRACGGNITDAAARLGLKNRFTLYRLMKKWNISAQ